ncbi:MAG: hypothetical protein GY727_12335 [Gammaproteobacteria bacterium]|nr:hypothetical protein [Gammaproteobacteria bacterium]
MVATNGLVGRVHECEEAIAALRKGHNVLIKGRAGVGKSAVLEAVAQKVQTGFTVIRVPFIAPKQALIDVAEQLHAQVGLVVSVKTLPSRVSSRARLGQPLYWDDIARTIRREPVDQLVGHIEQTLRKHRCLLVVDALEVSPTFANALDKLINHAQIIAGMDDTNRRVRIAKLLWCFNATVVLKPLSLFDCEVLIESSCKVRPLRFADHRTQRLFTRHIAQASNGIPAALFGMLDAARAEDRITPAMVRGFNHEAGTRYLDMTPMLVLVLVVPMATRYIGRGVGEVELMVLSGVSTALFMGLRYFLMVMRR